MGNQIDGQIGTAVRVAFGAAYDSPPAGRRELSNFLDMSDDLLTEPLHIRDGELHRPPRTPAIGVDIDPDKLRHYRHDS